jgi:hypothetical protein
MIEYAWPGDLDRTPSNRLLVWNRRLKAEFPTRLVGELKLSEDEFRELLSDVRESENRQSLVSPRPTLYARITLAIMTFTARYDYEGSFWKAFERNLGLDGVSNSAWGDAYNKALKDFKLFIPPKQWMINVFPVLYHSIVPERSLENFALMVRALCDVTDIRLWDNTTLGEALDSADLPILLRRFVTGQESRVVAQELVRSVAEDYRLGANLSGDTFQDRILAIMRSASELRARAFDVRIQPLPWGWDFNTGRCGVWLAASRRFDRAPVSLQIADEDWEVRSQRTSGTWNLVPQLLPLPLSTGAARGAIKSYGDDDLMQVRVGCAPQRPPYIFRAGANSGVYDSSTSGIAGDYAIASGTDTRVIDAAGGDIECLEDLPVPMLSGTQAAGIYSLNEGDQVLASAQCVFAVVRATRPSVELRGRTSWLLTSARGELPVYHGSPSLDVRSPQANSTFLLFEDTNAEPQSTLLFADRYHARPKVRNGVRYRASVAVDGRSAGTSSVEFMVLPIQSAIQDFEGRLCLCLSGEGSLTMGERKVTLQEDEPLHIGFGELLANDTISYEFAGRFYALRYSGRRPTLWGLERAALDHRVLTIRVDRIEANPRLFVSGIPGTTVHLAIGGARFASTKIGTRGLATISLQNCIPIARGRDSAEVMLITDEGTWHALTIPAVPQVGYDGIATSRRGVSGELCLDSPVEQLNLEARAFHKPWIPLVVVPFEGMGQRWTIDVQLPEERWELALASIVAGARVPIMHIGEPWARHFRTAADTRSVLDELLYSILVGGDDIDLDSVPQAQIIEMIARGFTMLSTGTVCRQQEGRLRELFRASVKRLRVCDAMNVETILRGMSNPGLTKTAAVCGLPVAAFDVLPFVVPQPSGPPSAREIFTMFKRLAAAPRGPQDECAFAQVIAQFESDAHPLIACYARLLRQLSTRETSAAHRLAGLVRRRSISEALLEVDDCGGTRKWVSSSTERSLFGSIVTRLWCLAVIARKAHVREAAAAVPAAVCLISPLIYDDNLGELTRIALSWADR